jgi:hypothetical protein
MNLTRWSAIVLALICVALAAVAFNLRDRNRQLASELDEIQSQRAKRGAFVSESLDGDGGGYRMALEAEAAANAVLREENARLRRSSNSTVAVSSTNAAAEPDRASGRGGGSDWMERMRTEDPERYKQILAERAQRRQAQDQWYRDQITALDQRAQTATSRQEAELATQIADQLAKLSDLRSQWEGIRQLPEEERRAAIDQLREASRTAYQTLNTLREQDRNLQMVNYLKGLGVTDPLAGAEGIKGILNATQYHQQRGDGSRWDGGGGNAGPQSNPPR